MMDKNEIVQFLSELPNEKTRDYELMITRFAGKRGDSIDSILEKIIEESTEDIVAYNAFYCLNVINRRNKDYAKLQLLFDKYETRFCKHITYDHLKALYDIDSDNFYDYTEILKTTYKDSLLFNDNAGFVHAFASVFATIYERGGLKQPAEFVNEWYDLVLKAINHAIKLDPNYAKYYCTKARIICIKGEYREADILINKAISYEDSKRNDYALRISNYQYYKMMVQMYIKMDKLKKEILTEYGISGDSHFDIPEGNASVSVDDDSPTAYEGAEPYAFVSYSHKDTETVYQIIRLLQKAGIRIWYDYGIPVGTDYAEVIGEKIADSSAYIQFISPNSINSEFCRKELNLASRFNLKPCIIYLSETTLSPGMMLRLDLYEQLRWYKLSKKAFSDKIIPILAEKLKKEK